MKHHHVSAALILALVGYPCAASALDLGGLKGAGTKIVQVVTLSDSDIKVFSDKACAQSDKQEQLATAGSQYDAKLQKLSKALGAAVNGQLVNYKVYITRDVNAWAMAAYVFTAV